MTPELRNRLSYLLGSSSSKPLVAIADVKLYSHACSALPAASSCSEGVWRAMGDRHMSSAGNTMKDVQGIATVPLPAGSARPSAPAPAPRLHCKERNEAKKRGWCSSCMLLCDALTKGRNCWFSALMVFYVSENAF